MITLLAIILWAVLAAIAMLHATRRIYAPLCFALGAGFITILLRGSQ